MEEIEARGEVDCGGHTSATILVLLALRSAFAEAGRSPAEIPPVEPVSRAQKPGECYHERQPYCFSSEARRPRLSQHLI